MNMRKPMKTEYKCGECGFADSNESVVRKHLRKQHGYPLEDATATVETWVNGKLVDAPYMGIFS